MTIHPSIFKDSSGHTWTVAEMVRLIEEAYNKERRVDHARELIGLYFHEGGLKQMKFYLAVMEELKERENVIA